MGLLGALLPGAAARGRCRAHVGCEQGVTGHPGWEGWETLEMGKGFWGSHPDPNRLVTCGEPRWLWGVQVSVLGSAAAPRPRNTPGTEQEHGSPQPPAAQPLPCHGRKPSARRMLHVGWEGRGHAGAACGAELAGTMGGKTQGQGVPGPGRHILFSQGKPLRSPPALPGAEAETQWRHGAVGRPVVGVGSV